MKKFNYKLLVCALACTNIMGVAMADSPVNAEKTDKAVVSIVEGSNDKVNNQIKVAAEDISGNKGKSIKIGTNNGEVDPEAVLKMNLWNEKRPSESSLEKIDKAYDGLTVINTSIEGDTVGNKEDLLNSLALKAGDKLTIGMLEQSRREIAATGYFYDNYPTFEKVDGGVKVVFHVMENPILKSVEISGNKVMPTSQVLSLLKGLSIGSRINTAVLNEDLANIENTYHEAGYILAKIQDISIDESGNLILKFNEGIIEGYEVKGNDKTKTKVILREMRQKPGSVFNSNLARRSLQRVYNLGYFEDVNVKLLPGTKNPNDVIMELDVTEKRTGTFGIGAGYSSEDGFVGQVSIADTNFRGMGDTIQASYEFGGSSSSTNGYNLGYTRPWLDSKETTGSFRFYNRKFDYDDYNNKGQTIETFRKKTSGYEFSFGRPVDEYTMNFLGVKLYKTEYLEWKGGEKGYLNKPWLDHNFGTTRSITFTQVRDTRDNIYYPTEGTRYSYSLEKAGFGGHFSYTKATGTLQRYFKVGRSQVVAFKGSFGFSPNNLPQDSIFEVGGQNSLRGYKDGQFIGNKMILGTLEYRFPMIKKVQGAFFVDAGDAWGGKDWGRGNTIEDKMKIHSSVGFGVQMETPLGPLRFDYALGQDGGRTHFNIGGTF